MIGFAALAILGGCSASGDSSAAPAPCDTGVPAYDECGGCTVRPEDATWSTSSEELAFWNYRAAPLGGGGLEPGARAPRLLVTASEVGNWGLIYLREWRDGDFGPAGTVAVPAEHGLSVSWRQGTDVPAFILADVNGVYTASDTGYWSGGSYWSNWEVTEQPEDETQRWVDIDGNGSQELVAQVYDDGAHQYALTDGQDFYVVDDISDADPQPLGDVDGDGIRDLALRSQDGSESWSKSFLLTGPLESGVMSDQVSGMVRKQWISSYYGEDLIAEPGDVDGDGRDDLLLTFVNGAKASSYLLFAGDSWWSSSERDTEPTATFEAVDSPDDPEASDLPYYAIGHVLSDLTGDGTGEIVIQQGAHREYPSGLFYGPFSGVRDLYAPDELYPAGQLATGDWDLDGVDDVVVGIRETERLYFWSGGGVGLYR